MAVALVLHYSGLLRAWQSIVLRRRAVVLMYHRVLDRAERDRTASHPAIVVDRETFARHMAVLKRRFRVLSLDEFAGCLENGRDFPSSSCLITFDDGWRDTMANALPILKRHGLPALVFLPTRYVGTRRLFWQEALVHLLARTLDEVRRSPVRLPVFRRLLEPVGLQDLLGLSAGDPRAAITARLAVQKRQNVARLRELPGILARELDVPLEDLAPADGFIGWDDVEEMTAHRIAFGGHGAEHLLLTEVPLPDAAADIRASKIEMDRRINHTVPTFSYPNGYYTSDIVDAVRSSGYRLAFVTRRGFVSCHDDRFTIARSNVHESMTGTIPMFLARVLGVF